MRVIIMPYIPRNKISLDSWDQRSWQKRNSIHSIYRLW